MPSSTPAPKRTRSRAMIVCQHIKDKGIPKLKTINPGKRASPARPDSFNQATGHAQAGPCRPISYRARARAGPYTQTLGPARFTAQVHSVSGRARAGPIMGSGQ